MTGVDASAVILCSTCGARALGRPNFWSCRLCDSFGTEAEPMEEPQQCAGCDTYFADPPSELCPGCEAYAEHQR